jgi:NAD(P)-dependent dehydrogenase (short-subunit alcohol dehydrogenase family)
MTNTENTQTKIALVTGANKGIGKEIARGLAQRGFTVLLGARDAERGLTAAAGLAADGHVFFQQIDVTDAESVAAAAKHVDDRYGRLDVLINNAGISGGRSTPSEDTAERMRQVFETNVFGVVTAIHAFLPLLRKSAAGRIVNVSSLLGSLTDQGTLQNRPSMPYASSKTALNAITIHYAHELADTNIKVNAASPGYVATDLNHFSGFMTPAQGAEIEIELAMLDADGPTGGFFNADGPMAW